ncbi:MAG: hypothetical protein JWO53_583 [Chlamydiia bacterium]|nr:hypothetical protein [Chlamydiia bacterium]
MAEQRTLRSLIYELVSSIELFDRREQEQIEFVKHWIASGAELFRIKKPATPETHLVAYTVLVDIEKNCILLTDHKKAQRWVPPGGHVDPGEYPKDTVKRELREELGIEANFLFEEPLFLTVTSTTGKTSGHKDVSLWYVLRGSSDAVFEYDTSEFHDVKWVDMQNLPYDNADPHLQRFIEKLKLTTYLPIK